MGVCVCVCVSERVCDSLFACLLFVERERETEAKRESERERVRLRVRVYWCVYAHAWVQACVCKRAQRAHASMRVQACVRKWPVQACACNCALVCVRVSLGVCVCVCQ